MRLIAIAVLLSTIAAAPVLAQDPPATDEEPLPPALEALLAGPESTVVPDDGIGLPMELDPSGRPIVSVRVDGRGPYRFGIDWGANVALVSERVAREADLPVEGQVAAPDGVDRDVARIDELEIGGARLRGLRATVGGFLDSSVDGILGFNAFWNLPVTLDFPAGSVRIGGPGAGKPDGGRTLALAPGYGIGNARPAITIGLGDLEATAELDTRSPLPLVVPATLRDRFTSAGESVRARGRGAQTGEMEFEIVPVVEPLVLGAQVVETPLVAFRSLPDADPEARLFDRVVLGGPLLREFAITLDLGAGSVRFDRESDEPIRLPAPQPRPAGS
jgi:hypothetical protein